MDENQDIPEITESAGLEDALDGAWGEEDDQEVEETTEVEAVEEKTSEDPDKVSEPEEGFTNLDPEKLPDEVKPFYKSMQASYTKKRQEETKRLSDLERKLEEASSAKQQMDHVSDLIAKAQNGDELAFRQLMEIQNNPAETEEQKIRKMIQQEREEAFYKEARTEYPKLDARVDETSPEYDPVLDNWLKAQLADALDDHWDTEGTSLGFDYKTTGSNLVKKFDQYLISKNTAYMKRQSEMAKKKSVATRKMAPKTSSANSNPNKNLSLDESIEAAISSN